MNLDLNMRRSPKGPVASKGDSNCKVLGWGQVQLYCRAWNCDRSAQ